MHIPAKKSLGQNFLKSEEALLTIVKAAKISPEDTLLEVGPGKGKLTEKLLAAAGKVLAIEKDDRLIPVLKEKFATEISAGKFILIHADILECDLKQYGLEAGKFKIVANLPYYITGHFMRLFLSGEMYPNTMVLLLQKEVAKRIAVHDLKESLLSISVRAYGDVKYHGIVKAKYFQPQPKVDSAIIAIKNINRNRLEGIDEKTFFEILKTGFAHKRKKLIGNLSAIYPSETLKNIFTELSLSENTRPEEVGVEKWITLSKQLSQKL